MIPYFIVLFLIIIFAIADKSSKNNAWKVLIFIVFTLFSGLRYYVGIDYESYSKSFQQIEGYYVNEPGTLFIFSVLRFVGGTEQLYFLLMAAITQLFVYKVLVKLKNGFWLSVFVYYCISLFYMASFNAVRQYAAIAIVTWSLSLIEKDKFLKYFCVILTVSFLFHYSALLFIPLFFYLRKQHSIWLNIGLIGAVIILNKVMLVVLSYTPYLKYAEAMNDRDVEVESIQYLFAIFSFAMMLVGSKFERFKDNCVIYNMNCMCMYTLLLVIMQTSGTLIMLFQRYNNYFIFSYLLIIPAVLSSMKKKNSFMARQLVVVISVLYLLRTIVINGDHYMLVPYDMSMSLFNF